MSVKKAGLAPHQQFRAWEMAKEEGQNEMGQTASF